ncbi:MAG: bifunctional 5,10-methylenetetrahydrofolate dehydrogenase/5,10-methenyltetrahydrofolate cyclohydrolase [Synergistaceae bacterium]|nr:bifunctional 5,10-methylenetetrahydrofolate dehydrogenase/5,10-methenyltetrahydrofolate cyclohydrolase [Synergistaceae bacterium]
MALIMKGSEVSASMKLKLAEEISQLGFIPSLAIIRVGSRPDDLAYERGILKRFEGLGLNVKVHELPEDISQADFDAEFSRLNDNKDIHGILLFRPLPANLSDEFAVNSINPKKDIDCMSKINIAGVFSGDNEAFAPCTASAVMEMLSHYNVDLQGKNVAIVGRSLVVGRPLSMLMLAKNATVTICHTKTQNLPEVCKRADILVAAAGKAGVITSEFVSDKSIVLDVGINVNAQGKLCGDVDYENVAPIVQAISPVPGGVGAVTTSVLAKNLIRAAKLNAK